MAIGEFLDAVGWGGGPEAIVRYGVRTTGGPPNLPPVPTGLLSVWGRLEQAVDVGDQVAVDAAVVEINALR